MDTVSKEKRSKILSAMHLRDTPPAALVGKIAACACLAVLVVLAFVRWAKVDAASVRLADDTSFFGYNCFHGVPSGCVLSLGPFWRYNPSRSRRVPSPLSWALIGGVVISVPILVLFAKRRFHALEGAFT